MDIDARIRYELTNETGCPAKICSAACNDGWVGDDLCETCGGCGYEFRKDEEGLALIEEAVREWPGWLLQPVDDPMLTWSNRDSEIYQTDVEDFVANYRTEFRYTDWDMLQDDLLDAGWLITLNCVGKDEFSVKLVCGGREHHGIGDTNINAVRSAFIINADEGR